MDYSKLTLYVNASLSSLTSSYNRLSIETKWNLNPFISFGIGALSLAWIVKRFSWRSHPFFNDPRSPPFVPYFIPYIGSGISLQAAPAKFMEHWAHRLNSSIFSAYISGKSMIFITDSAAATQVISGRIPQLSWNSTLELILRSGFGLSSEGAKEVAKNDHDHAIYDKHLMKTGSLEQIVLEFQESLTDKVSKMTKDEQCTWSTKGIMDFFCKLIYFNNTDVLMGYPSLATDEFFENSLIFERYIARFFKEGKSKEEQKKRKALREGYEAREKLVDHFKKILSSKDDLSGDDKPSGLVQEIMDAYKPKLTIEDEIHRQLTFHWATYTNAIPTTFWLVYNLLSHDDAYKAVKKEIRDIHDMKLQNENESKYFTLSDLDRMVNLDSILTETIRLTTAHRSFKFRTANRDFEIKLNVDKKKRQFNVKKDTIFITSTTLDHRDEEVFEDALKFKWDRFLPGNDGKPPVFRKNGKILVRPVNPFGGGATICPGRRFAITEIKILLATILLEFDIQFKDKIIPEAPKKFQNGAVSSTGFPYHDVDIEILKGNALFKTTTSK